MDEGGVARLGWRGSGEDLREVCSCGNKLMPDAEFCRKCGTKRGGEDDEAHGSLPDARGMPQVCSMPSDACSRLSSILEPKGFPIDELWAENQELHDRIALLERQLDATAADATAAESVSTSHSVVRRTSTAASSILTASSALQRGSRCSFGETSYILPASLPCPAGDERELKIDELVSQRSRLLWQKAILSVRLWNSRARLVVGRMKLSGVEVRSRRDSAAVEDRLQRSLREQEQLHHEEKRDLCDLLSSRMVQKEKSFQNQLFSMRQSQPLQGRRFSGSSFGNSAELLDGEDSPFGMQSSLPLGMNRRGSLASSLGHQDSEMTTRSSTASGPPVGTLLSRRDRLLEMLQGQLEELRTYSLALERQLVEVLAEKDEALTALQGRIQEQDQGEEDAAPPAMSMWSWLELCTSQRDGRQLANTLPPELPSRSGASGDAPASPAFLFQGALV